MPTKDGAYSALYDVIDPEIGLDIVSLGLVYNIDVSEDGREVKALITFTTQGCPAGDMIYNTTYSALQQLLGVEKIQVDVTFDPPWNPTMMSDEAKMILGR